MKRHFFMEDARSFHICLCLHFKVSVTGCLGLKRKGRRAERRSKEGVVVGVCWLQGPEGQYMQPKCRLAWKYSTVSLNTVIELDVFMLRACIWEKYISPSTNGLDRGHKAGKKWAVWHWNPSVESECVEIGPHPHVKVFPHSNFF